MIARRYPLILAGLCVALLATAASGLHVYIDLSAQINDLFSTGGGQFTEEIYAHYAELQALSSALNGVILPAFFAAGVAAIAGLVLLVLRSRARER